MRGHVPTVLLLVWTAACGPRVPVLPGPKTAMRNPPPPSSPLDRGPADEAVATRAPRPPAPVRPRPATTPRATAPGRPSPLGPDIGASATHYLSHRPPSRFRDDCSGLVMAILDRAGAPVVGNTASLYATAESLGALHHRKRPAVGDLVFFDHTYDRNRNGRVDDPLSHVGVVNAVTSDGTITVVHRSSSRGRTTLVMNLHHPHDTHGPDGQRYNDFLRARRRSDGPRVRHLAGELWRAFATVDPADLDVWLR